MCVVFIVGQGSNGCWAHFVYCLSEGGSEDWGFGTWSVKNTLEYSKLGAFFVTSSLLHRDLQTGIFISHEH